MRLLAVTRGAQGSGKSTFIKNIGLEPCTISPDSIRLLMQSPIMIEDGGFAISQKNDKRVFKLLHQLLEERMERGEFIVVDATHSRGADFKKYKELAKKYKYRIVCIDFTDVPIEVAKKQNQLREMHKIVPEHRIEELYKRFETNEVPKGIDVVSPSNFESYIFYASKDFSSYKRIHHIGDVHGCYTALQDYFRTTGHSIVEEGHPQLHEDELYIFVGDLCDRGIQNVDVLNFMINIKGRDNVIIIEGNHEKYLKKWANDESGSRAFELYTKPELIKGEIEGKITKSDIRQLYRKLNQLSYYTYNGKKILVTHGGIPRIPFTLTLLSTNQLINGVGDYAFEVDQEFIKNTNKYTYQIHGHRNTKRHPIQVNERCYNLEGQVEMGGHLRAVTLDHEGFKTYEIKNNVYNTTYDLKEDTSKSFIEQMRSHPQVRENDLGNGISSFNFTREAFRKKSWDNTTVRARGLFINTGTQEIVARGYEKFFNVNERHETTIRSLQDNLTFPVTAYLKENGYLGIVGYNSESNEVIFASKSSTHTPHAKWLESMFMKAINKASVSIQDIKTYLREENATLMFEVIDPINDPHIIEYEEEHLVLLDIVHRVETFSKKPMCDIQRIANWLGLKSKKTWKTFKNWEEFFNSYQELSEDTSLKIEGLVIEDATSFMTKIKLPYYSFWKKMRGVMEIMRHDESKVNIGKIPQEGLGFFRWMQFYKGAAEQDFKTTSIIKLRNQYFLKN